MNCLATIAFAAALAVPAASAFAATIVGQPFAAPAMPANISAAGELDWGYWHINSTSFLDSRVPTNEKAGASIIGAAFPVGGTGLRGSTTNVSQITFSFDDGASPESGQLSMRGVFTTPGTVLGRGVEVSLTLPEAQQAYAVMLWVSGYRSQGTVSATLAGTDGYVDSSFTYGDNKEARLYQFEVAANQPGDVLKLSYLTSVATDVNSHVLLGGVAISAVPEPTALALLVPMAALSLRRRARQSHH